MYDRQTGGQDGVVGIATHHRLDRLQFKPFWGQDFPDLSRLVPRPTQPPLQWELGLFPRRKAVGAWH
jgi:hypothetical protein